MMKKLLFLLTLCAVMVGCKTENGGQTENNTGLSIDDSQLKVELSSAAETKTVSFTAYESWTVTVPSSIFSWCEVTPRKGNAGKASLSVKTQANTTGEAREFTMTLKAGDMSRDITVTQLADSQIVVDDEYHVGFDGGEYKIEVKTNVDFTTTVRKSDAGWIKVAGSESGGTRALDLNTKTVVLNISASTDKARREGKITLTAGSFYKDVAIVQDEFYESTDMSANGTIVVLNKADVATSAVNIVLMGDGFSDRQIADGTYRTRMEEAMDALFWLEPYKSFKHLFNVSYVNVVSKNEGYYTGSVTALKGFFTEGSTIVGGDNESCKNYAKSVPGVDIDMTLVVVLMNKKVYGGTCYQSRPSVNGDYGMGCSVAYFPLGTDADMFKILLTHEACGHGFGKLGDEYYYDNSGDISASDKDLFERDCRYYGWNKNLDVTGDRSAVKWKHFLEDARYAQDGLGVFQGGNIYQGGVWRPTDDSMMNNNQPYFNAPSREAIYYRIHKLAYGTAWTYDYEEFVKYDAVNRKAEAQAKLRTRIPYDYPRLSPPVICE